MDEEERESKKTNTEYLRKILEHIGISLAVNFVGVCCVTEREYVCVCAHFIYFFESSFVSIHRKQYARLYDCESI